MKSREFIIYICIAAIIAILMFLSICTQSKSGAIKTLRETGVLVTDNDLLFYYTDGYITSEELNALEVLSNDYTICAINITQPLEY